MNCHFHSDVAATSICIQCGRALCEGCKKLTKTDRVICSSQCEDQLSNVEDALRTLREKTEKGYKLTGLYTISIGVLLFILAAIVIVSVKNKTAAVFPAGMGAIFVGFGIYFYRIFQKKKTI